MPSDRLAVFAEDGQRMRHRIVPEGVRRIHTPTQAGDDVPALEVVSVVVDHEQTHRVGTDVNGGASHSTPERGSSTQSGLRWISPSISATHSCVQLRGSTPGATDTPIGLALPAEWSA